MNVLVGTLCLRVSYLLCLVAGGTILSDRWSQHKTQVKAASLSPQALVGKTLDVPGANWSASGTSTVLFLSTECHFCDASMLFYRQLAEAHQQASKNRTALIGITREPRQDMENHLARNHVGFDHVYQLPATFKLLTGTPTLLVVDRQGVIQRAFVGELNARQEHEVLSLIKDGETAMTRTADVPGALAPRAFQASQKVVFLSGEIPRRVMKW